MEQNFVDIGLLVAYGLLGLGALAAIIMPLINALGNPRSLLMGLVGIIFIAAIYGIAYSVSGDEVTATYAKFGIDSGMSQFVGAGIITMYFLLALSLIGIVITELYKLLS